MARRKPSSSPESPESSNAPESPLSSSAPTSHEPPDASGAPDPSALLLALPPGSTHWHVGFIAIMLVASPLELEILVAPELTRGPLKADMVVVYKRAALRPEFRFLPALFSRFTECNVIEFKRPTRLPSDDAFFQLQSYGHRFRMQENETRAKKKRPRLHDSEITLFLLVETLPGSIRKTIEGRGGIFIKEDDGVWKVERVNFRFYIIELKRCGAQEREHLWRLCTREALTDSRAIWESMSPEERQLFMKVYPLIQQKLEGKMFEEFRAANVYRKGLSELYQEAVREVPLQDVLRVHTAEDVLSRYAPEERLKGLGAEERLKGLGAEERLKGLGAEERLKGLSPAELDRIRRLLT